jgi:hypothetical protein
MFGKRYTPGIFAVLTACLAVPVAAQTSAPAAQTRPTGALKIVPAATLEEGLAFDKDETIAIAAVRDRISQLDETPFYMMLHHVATLPAISDAQYAALDMPSYANLLAEPARYRARPMRMTVLVVRVRKIFPERGMSNTPYWPKDRCVWRMDCLNADSTDPVMQPVIVFSTMEPAELGDGRPGPDADVTEYPYPGSPKARIAGVFYKVQTDADLSGVRRDYPVILGSQVVRLTPFGYTSPWPKEALLVGGVAVLGVAFVALRIRVRRAKGESRRRRPRREPPGVADVPVDESLQKAAKDFRRGSTS